MTIVMAVQKSPPPPLPLQTPPLVLLLDMDNTIIGNSVLQVCRYELSNTMHHKVPMKLMMQDLGQGLLRPNFESFIKTVAARYPNIEIFIFTASEAKWARYVIMCIEHVIQHKFNRPIFARHHCQPESVFLKKSINKVLPAVYKALRSKYNLSSPHDLDKQVVLVDNNTVIMEEDINRFVKCPGYERFVVTDILAAFPQQLIQSHASRIAAVLARYGITSKDSLADTTRMMNEYYKTLTRLTKASQNQNQYNDNFWFEMERIFKTHEIRRFNKKTIAYIQSKVLQHSAFH